MTPPLIAIELAKFAAFAWLSLTALWALRRLLGGAGHTVLYALLLHWVLCGLPLALDLIAGVPVYSYSPVLNKAARDPTTDIIYLSYIAVIPPILVAAGMWRLRAAAGRLTAVEAVPRDRLPRAWTWLCALLIASPVVAVLATPRPELYARYGFIADIAGDHSQDIFNWHAVVQICCYLAVIASAILIINVRSAAFTALCLLPSLAVDVFLSGKRLIVVLLLYVLSKALWDRGLLRGARLPIYLVACLCLFGVFTTAYQSGIRGVGSQGGAERESAYENARIDYGRDHTIKLAIHAEVEGERIMDDRSAGLRFLLGMYIPRAWWPEKPYPYATYLTCYYMGVPPTYLTWGLTLSIFDEAVATLGWLGLILGPLTLALICRVNDGNGSWLLRMMGLVLVMSLMTAPLAFMPMPWIWLGWALWERTRGFFTTRTSAELRERRTLIVAGSAADDE